MALATLSTPLANGGQVIFPPIGTLTTAQYLANLYAAVKTAFGKALATPPSSGAYPLLCGTLYDDQSAAASGSQIVYQIFDGTSGTYNNGFLSIAFAVSGQYVTCTQNFQRAWNLQTHTVPTNFNRGPNSGWGTTNFNINASIQINWIKHQEKAFLYLDQGQTPLWILGAVRPFNLLNWNTNIAPFIFIPQSDNLNYLMSIYYSEHSYSANSASYFTYANTYSLLKTAWTGGDGTSSEIQGIPIFSNDGSGVVGYTSTDIAAVPGTGKSRLTDTLTNSDNSIYTYLTARTDTSSIAIRTA